MAAVATRGAHHHTDDHENGERWLLTYSDMMTLLLALFMVLFSISSVNISKYDVLQQSLKSAFSGSVLTGGRSVLQTGSSSTSTSTTSSATEIPSLVPLTPTVAKPSATSVASQAEISKLTKEAQAASQEQSELTALQHRLNAYAAAHGWQKQVTTQIEQRGLVVTVLTDKLLFASGSAQLDSAADPLLNEIAKLIGIDSEKHPIVVEGYTDNNPIDTVQYPTNFDLSSARANSVLTYLLSRDVPSPRLSSAGYGQNFPVASNATAAGKALNRRVEVVFQRKYPTL